MNYLHYIFYSRILINLYLFICIEIIYCDLSLPADFLIHEQWKLSVTNNWDIAVSERDDPLQPFIRAFRVFAGGNAPWFRRDPRSMTRRGFSWASKWGCKRAEGYIIVRRLICLLYTAGGLLSGIPFYGAPRCDMERAARREAPPLRTRHMLLHHVAHCDRDATPVLRCARKTNDRTDGWTDGFRSAKDERGLQGASNRVPLDTVRWRPPFNRVWSSPPGRPSQLASRHVNVSFLSFCCVTTCISWRRDVWGDEYTCNECETMYQTHAEISCVSSAKDNCVDICLWGWCWLRRSKI